MGDIKDKENWTLSKPQVAGNKVNNDQGEGCVHILLEEPDYEPVGVVEIVQVETWIEGEKVRKKTRRGYVSGPVLDMIEIGYEVGNKVGGRVIIVEQYDPPVPEDPTRFIAYRDGKIRRCNGRVIYRTEHYSFSAYDKDQYIDDITE